MADIGKQAELMGLVDILHGRRVFDEMRLDLYRPGEKCDLAGNGTGTAPGKQYGRRNQ
jgi:hypothetical protein